jgi:hypothetical protein
LFNKKIYKQLNAFIHELLSYLWIIMPFFIYWLL